MAVEEFCVTEEEVTRHLLPLKGSSLSFSHAFSVASSPPRKLGLATIWSAAGYKRESPSHAPHIRSI